MREILNLILLDHYPILEQLKLEEALLRADDGNWCLINQGTPPAIVMGISADPAQVVNLELLKKQPVPLIRRYSGGGTVFVDEHTLFVTLILNRSTVPTAEFPKEVMEWSRELYKKLPFGLQDNDYVIENRKCGGNAQYFTKYRFVHHTSFLWDYTPHHMDYLLHPPKMPAYREDRPHKEFLCTLKPFFCTQMDFVSTLLKTMGERFEILHRTLDEAKTFQLKEHRVSTEQLSC